VNKTSARGTTPKAKSGNTGKKSEDRAIPLTPEHTRFQEALRACTVMERKLVLGILNGHNNTQAAIAAGYSAKSAPEQASTILTRQRVKDALEAGYEAAGISSSRTLAFIAALANFDRSQITTVVRQRTVDHIERPAQQVAEEVKRELDIVRLTVDDLRAEKASDAELKPLEQRLSRLRLRLMDLEILLDRDPDAYTIVEIETLQDIPLIDLKKAHALGLSRFIKNVKRDKYGYQVELHDFLDGVDRAAKVHGLYKETLSVQNPDGTPLEQVRGAGPEDMAKLLAAYDQLRSGS
jgi:phage terminase small subunit